MGENGRLALDPLEATPAGVIGPVRSGARLSIRHAERLAEAGVARSVGSVRNSYDNALAESVNALFKAEVSDFRGPWKTFEAVGVATLEWTWWFNSHRLLGPIGNVPPIEHERAYHQQANDAAFREAAPVEEVAGTMVSGH